MVLTFEQIKKIVSDWIVELKSFDFYIYNLSFWALLILLFLILLKFWNVRKSFSFCVIAGALLLGATQLENYIQKNLVKAGAEFDSFFIYVFAIIIIAVVGIYYFFIKPSE